MRSASLVPHRAPPFNRSRHTEAPPPRRRRGLVSFRPVESVEPGEAVQQSTRVDILTRVLDGDDDDLKDGVREMGVHGEAGEATPNARVNHLVLVGVIPPIGHLKGLNGADIANDRKETPEHLTTLLAAATRGADMMIRALDVLRAIGYVDMRPIALLGREIIFGLDRVALELEILEDNDGEIECNISVTGENVKNVEEIERVLERKGVDLI